MRILINATSARLGGGITVLKNLLPALCAEDGGRHSYRVVARADVRPQLDPHDPRVVFELPPLASSIAARVAWEQLGLPLRALGQADLLFSPANLATLASPVPQVLMVQNLAPFDPDVVARCTRSVRMRLRLLKDLGIVSARRSKRVVLISDFARALLAPLFKIPAANLSRIHLGRDDAFSPQARERAPQLLDSLGVRAPYLLSVGQFYPYKNIVELVIGFARARPALPPGIQLVLAGAEHEATVVRSVKSVIAREGLESSVRMVGQVAYEDLPPLYAAASMFIFPSSCENFPNILVEGLSSGVPVLSSRLGPMREIAGAGADYFDPFDPDDIASAIVRLHGDSARQAELRKLGVAAAGRYSWNTTARELLDVFDAAAA